ncbi:hypothetical protein [Photobacterium kishitanii]|uniref:hypothetical protein n=1 Tax=Photobacterium kishitanii TaxID=318456 RepID=UPI00071AEF76|nr:hypothetical protein [Photobacterium kishitanii]PSV17161.1 hypothetical protein C0W59_03405 [Photobacterium kishitanii]
MNYLAVFLGIDGRIVRNNDTSEVMNLQLGEFDNLEVAIESAKSQLEYEIEQNGVLVKGSNQGGFLICDIQEFAEL